MSPNNDWLCTPYQYRLSNKGMCDFLCAQLAEQRGGADVIFDYNGNPVLSVYGPLKIHGLNWAIIAEIDLAEAFSPVDEEGNEFYAKYQEMYASEWDKCVEAACRDWVNALQPLTQPQSDPLESRSAP